MTDSLAVDESPIDADDIKRHTEIVDITDDPGWLAAARWEVAVGYSRLASPDRKLRLRDVYMAICQDGYERDGRSRTLAALTSDPVSGTREISGSVRLVLGREQRDPSEPPPIDAMVFVTPLDQWPHRRSGLGDGEICELTRFIVTEKYRTASMRRGDVGAFITGSLVRGARALARGRGASVMYGLMPARVAELVMRGGTALADVPVGFNTNDPGARQVFESFSLYWQQTPAPRLYVMTESPAVMAAAFRASLPAESVIDDPAILARRYAANVTALHRRVPLALRPATEDEVMRIVAIANEQRIPLHPFSTGKNWGLGSKLPVTDDCAIVDLSRMDRIVQVSEEFAYAILEPGVTQLQLARHLYERHPSLTLNFTGSFAHTGIVGNVLERGDGAHARVEDLLGVRGILGSGERFTVGGLWDRVGTDLPSHVSRYVAGPDLCGLFCQSNFGVITQLAFRLIRKPERRYVLWGTAGDDGLAALVDAIEPFAAQGLVNRGSVNIGYANRFVQAGQTMSGSAAPAPSEEWNFYVLIGATAKVADLVAQEIDAALSGVCARHGAFRIGREVGDHDPPDTLPPFLGPLLSPLLGMPDASSIRLIYDLTGTPLPDDEAEIDADRTPFGMKCWIGVVPPRGRDVRAAADRVAALRRRTGLNIKISFFGDGRTLVTIHFRTDDAAQVRAAEACEAALWDEMASAGFPLYRASIDQMQRLVESRPQDWALVARLKAALDPNGIISPGRYCPTRVS